MWWVRKKGFATVNLVDFMLTSAISIDNMLAIVE